MFTVSGFFTEGSLLWHDGAGHPKRGSAWTPAQQSHCRGGRQKKTTRRPTGVVEGISHPTETAGITCVFPPEKNKKKGGRLFCRRPKAGDKKPTAGGKSRWVEKPTNGDWGQPEKGEGRRVGGHERTGPNPKADCRNEVCWGRSDRKPTRVNNRGPNDLGKRIDGLSQIVKQRQDMGGRPAIAKRHRSSESSGVQN